MRKIILLFTIVFFAGCTNHYEKEFYGAYSIHDSTFMSFAKITFYPENTYSFCTSVELDGANRDSGSFVLNKDIIYFTSFDTKRDESDIKNNKYYKRTLTGKEFIYQKNKVGYVNKHIIRDGHKVNDTTFWTKDIDAKF